MRLESGLLFSTSLLWLKPYSEGISSTWEAKEIPSLTRPCSGVFYFCVCPQAEFDESLNFWHMHIPAATFHFSDRCRNLSRECFSVFLSLLSFFLHCVKDPASSSSDSCR